VVGGYLLDNHHFLPQKAGFTAVDTVGDAKSDSQRIARLPLQLQGFVSVEQVLGPHSALVMELLPRKPFAQSVATTGARWQLGGSEPTSVVAWDRIRFRIDLAGLWAYFPKNNKYNKDAFVAPIPWIGLGMYVL
jgi:hypothetical protein